MPPLVFSIHWNPKEAGEEVGSNDNEEMDLVAKREQADKEGEKSFLVPYPSIGFQHVWLRLEIGFPRSNDLDYRCVFLKDVDHK